jgi:flagellar basal-body rod protein FlgC
MNFLNALRTSSTGLSAQRLRMNLIASNLANVNTTRTSEGGPYRRKDVIFAAESSAVSFNDVMRSQMGSGLSGVKVQGVINDPRPPVMKYDPTHPDANKDGYVALPNVNIVEEMVNMISATRSYEANVAAIKATKSMALKALEIGG